jgi:hypothetical protein
VRRRGRLSSRRVPARHHPDARPSLSVFVETTRLMLPLQERRCIFPHYALLCRASCINICDDALCTRASSRDRQDARSLEGVSPLAQRRLSDAPGA